MGTRINVLMDHAISDYRDQSAVLARLAGTLSAALAVRNYWDSSSVAYLNEKDKLWIADPILPHEKHYCSYTGPGSLFLKIGPHTAKIRTGGRWRGFLSIPTLREVHLQAFRSIAEVLEARHIAYFPDDDELYDLFYKGGTFNEGIVTLERDFGHPQPSIEIIAPKIVEETDHGVPCIWYIDEILTKKIDKL